MMGDIDKESHCFAPGHLLTQDIVWCDINTYIYILYIYSNPSESSKKIQKIFSNRDLSFPINYGSIFWELRFHNHSPTIQQSNHRNSILDRGRSHLVVGTVKIRISP